MALIDRAAAAGYTGVAFWDVSSEFLNSPLWPAGASSYYQQAMAYARARGLQVAVPGMPYGYSNDVLENNPNWAESQRVVGTQYQVNSSGSALQIVNSFPGLLNSGFEMGTADWFDIGDPGVSVSTSVAHTGGASALISNAPANGRIRQEFTLQPWRQYHLRFFLKSQGYSGYAQFAVLNSANFSISPLSAPISVSPSKSAQRRVLEFATRRAPNVESALKLRCRRALRVSAAALHIWSVSGAFAVSTAIVASLPRTTTAGRMSTFLVLSHKNLRCVGWVRLAARDFLLESM